MALAFISHTDTDKPLVEPFALAAAELIGTENVFYDAWSIQPGDGIVAEMDGALGACTHFFLFMSTRSLTSTMVQLEWQNAVLRRGAGEMRLVPVRLDNCQPPALLLQLKYIDAYVDGLATALEAMKKVLSGESAYRPTPPAENLSGRVRYLDSGEAEITLSVAAYQEANPELVIVLADHADDLDAQSPSEPMWRYNASSEVDVEGRRRPCILAGKQSVLVPGRPFVVQVRRRSGLPVKVTHIALTTGESSARWLPFEVATS